MKIFEISWSNGAEKEYIAAMSNLDAVRIYCNEMEFYVNDFEENSEINEITYHDWDEYTVKIDDFSDAVLTFTEWMEDNSNSSGYICKTYN